MAALDPIYFIGTGLRLRDEQETQFHQIRAQEVGVRSRETWKMLYGAFVPQMWGFDQWLTYSVKVPASFQ